MKGYTNLIPENVAPREVSELFIKDNDNNEISIPFGRFTPPDSSKMLYSIGVVSDCHTYKVDYTGTQDINDASWRGNLKLTNALSFFKKQKCIMVIGCGDFSQTGFYYQNETSGNITLQDGTVVAKGQTVYFEHTMSNYSNIINSSNIPVYELFGNHESMYKSISIDLDRAKELTGIPYTSYTISNSPDSDTISNTQGSMKRPNRYAAIDNDIYILCGQPSYNAVMSDSDFQWLTETLKNNKDKRCFLFIHSYIEDDSGDPHDVRENSTFDKWGDGINDTSKYDKSDFFTLIQKYHNVIVFHGHSHMKFENQSYYDPTVDFNEMQQSYKYSNYTTINGFKSIHIPSLSSPRDINFDSNKSENDYNSSECYIIEVYADCIYLRGMSLSVPRNDPSSTVGTPSSYGTFKINT